VRRIKNAGVGASAIRQLAARRRQIIVILAALLCLYLPAAAQTAATPPSAPQGALFKITRAGHTLYLFGTIHVGRADFYPLEARVMQALGEASVLAVELDPSREDAMQTALRRYGMAAAGADALLPPALKTRRGALLRRYGIAPEGVARLQPWLQAVTLTVAEFTASGYQPQYAVDSHLIALFRQRGKPVRELESAESQMALFGALNRTEQLRFLDETMAELEDPAETLDELAIVGLWRNADSPGLMAKLEEMNRDKRFTTRFLQDVLLKRRNPRLADGINEVLQANRDSFAAIGIMHLIGPYSVPALLARRGCRVEQIY
jgi:uncharacterized protein YbaP (TraB family)